MDSVFENNILLTQTERLMMSGRPKQPKYARHDYTVGNGGLRVVAAMADKPVQRASLKEKLEAFKVQAAGAGKTEIGKAKGKEETL